MHIFISFVLFCICVWPCATSVGGAKQTSAGLVNQGKSGRSNRSSLAFPSETTIASSSAGVTAAGFGFENSRSDLCRTCQDAKQKVLDGGPTAP